MTNRARSLGIWPTHAARVRYFMDLETDPRRHLLALPSWETLGVWMRCDNLPHGINSQPSSRSGPVTSPEDQAPWQF